MSSFNKVILLGNLTRDPEFKQTPSGTPVTRLRLAVNETYKDKQTGQMKDVPCYVDVTVWSRQAETCNQYLSKGSQVLVEGRLIYDEWKTPQGETRSRVGVRAENVRFMNTGNKSGGSGSQQVHAKSEQYSAAPAAPAVEDNSFEPQHIDEGMSDDENLPF